MLKRERKNPSRISCTEAGQISFLCGHGIFFQVQLFFGNLKNCIFFFFWFCQLEMLETFPPIDMGFCFLINYVRTEMIQSMTFFESEQKFCQIECTFDGYDDMICTPLSNSQNSTRNSMVGLSCSIILTGKCFLF